jgi:hypothetical protein
VRNLRLSSLRILSVAAALVWLISGIAWAGKIESDPSKVYHLRKKHGPWMIKVASFSGESDEQRQNSIDAANQLVSLLRAKNIPAYIYQQDEQIEDIEVLDKSQRRQTRHYTAQHGEIAVLAGNYPSIEDKTAQSTLKFIKKMSPKVEVTHHGKQEAVPLNFKKAFMAPNPLIPSDELKQRTKDPLMVTLNSGRRNSLLENKGKYTLVVCSFYGLSSVEPSKFEEFEKTLSDRRNISLDTAGESADELATVLRNQYKLEAYVYHERFRSVVTVGSFATPKDPALLKLANELRCKEREDPRTKQKVLVGEAFYLLGKDGKTPVKSWTADPVPEVMEVPRW